MSSGSLVQDKSTPWTDPGLSWYGSKYSKSWSGGDAPKPSRAPRIPITLRRYSRKRGAYEVTIYIRDPNFSGAGNGKNRGEHAYSKTITDQKSVLVTFRPRGWTSDRTVATFGYCAFGSYTDFSTLGKSAKLAAQSELRSALQGGSEFNLGVSLGEMGESVGMIGDAARTISSSLLQVLRGNWLGAVETLFRHLGQKPKKKHLLPRNPTWVVQNASACWLELQYGWLPLLSDVKSAAEAFADHVSQPSRTSVRFGRELSEIVKVKSDFGNLGTHEGMAKKTATVHYKVTLEAPASVSSKLGLLDPLSIAWELVPLSFVADWFVPIGSYLSALGGANGLKIKSVTESIKWHSTYTLPFTGPCEYLSFNRSVSNVWPSPPLPKFKLFGDDVNFRHCVSGIALAVQRLK